MQLLILALLWAGWCAMHSLLVEDGFGGRVKRLLGSFSHHYRIFYHLFSFLSLSVPLSYSQGLSPVVYYEFHGFMQFVPLVLLSYGVIMFSLGCRAHDLFSFMGLGSIKRGKGNSAPGTATFRVGGILARLRHPWYSAAFALIWAVGSISDVSLTVKSILSLYLIIGTRLEEGRLLVKFGRDYADYCQKVPRFFPRLR